jgi:hypothetical protein
MVGRRGISPLMVPDQGKIIRAKSEKVLALRESEEEHCRDGRIWRLPAYVLQFGTVFRGHIG